MGKTDFESRPDCRQGSVCGIEQGVCVEIIHRSEPLPLEDAPKSLGNIEMRAIRREKEKEQPPLLPYGAKFPHKPAPVYTCVVKDHEGPSADTERHTVKKVSDLVCGHVLCRSESLISVPAVYHAEYIEPETSFRGDADIFTAELPSVWHISTRADMTLITIVKVYETVLLLLYEFLQLLALVGIELRRGSPLGTFPYTSVSRANADKKARKVLSLAFLPEACCQASFAFFTLCLSFSMALRTASSSELSIIGFRPRPGRVARPLTPSHSNRLTHEFTDMCVISV